VTKPKTFINRNFSIIIFFSILIGFLVRLISINQSLWLDEAISFEAASLSLKQYFSQFAPTDFNPPLYYLVLHFWLKIFPGTELFLRLPSLLFGLLTGIFVYQTALAVYYKKDSALLSLILLLTSPLHIYYSQEARPYSLAAFLASGCVYFFIKTFSELNKKNILLYIFFSVLMIYAHYLTAFLFIAQLIYVLIFYQKKLKEIIISLFSIFIIYLPWFSIFFKQLNIGQKVSKNWIWSSLGALTFKNLSLIPVKFIIGRVSFENKIIYLAVALCLLSFFGLLIMKNLIKSLKKDKEKKAWIVWFWLLVPVIIGIIVSIFLPVLSYFRYLFVLPALYILLSHSISFVKYKQVYIFALLSINIFFSFKYLLTDDYHRENWKMAVNVLHQKNINNLPVLIIENVSAPFKYYDKNNSQLIYIKDLEGIKDENGFWYIPYAEPIFDPKHKTTSFFLNNGFFKAYEEHFRGVTLEKWQKALAGRY
jgi:mannosyltransferase